MSNPSGYPTFRYTGFTGKAQAAFQRAVDIWASTLITTVPIEIDVNFVSADDLEDPEEYETTLAFVRPSQSWVIGRISDHEIAIPIALANIPTLVQRVSATCSDWPAEWELILVDDDSNDGSEVIAAEWGRRLPVRMVTRRGATRDLSLSVLHGMRLARFDRLVVMDADLSHPPEQILDLLAALDAECDMVVGSRYVREARVDPVWSRAREFLSRAGTLTARPLADCRDPLSGFFATDRRLPPDPEDLHPVGYRIALELMARGRLRVREVPIRFGARHRGKRANKVNCPLPFRSATALTPF